ncbi:MAG: response regulator [Pseudomonadota bacterium]
MGLLDSIKALFGGREPAPKEAPQETSPTSLGERRKRQRINPTPGTRALIIDDSPTVVLAMKRMLESAGIRTLVAPDAEKGLEIAKAEQPELIFLDIVLPGMNGFSALRHMRRDDQTRDTPVIMISGNEKAAEQFFGTRIGADDFMKKPFTRLDLFVRIEHLLDEERVPRRKPAEAKAAADTPA